MEGWIFGSAQQETCTQQFFKKKVDPCLHLKSRKDFSLEIFEHARSHNTENASELTVSAQTYSEPLPSEQSIMGCSSYGSRNARHFASVKMALATVRAFGLSKATSSTQCGGLTARTDPEVYFNVNATNCQTIVAGEFGLVTSIPPKCPQVFVWCRRMSIDLAH
jgi:hypothetical protein